MINHLPECERWYANMPEPDECPACEMFRACEQRVAEETEKAMMEFFYWKPSPPHDKHYFADNICSYCVGRREALAAAREAVAAVPHGISWGKGLHIHRDRVLAAIDALKEKP